MNSTSRLEGIVKVLTQRSFFGHEVRWHILGTLNKTIYNQTNIVSYWINVSLNRLKKNQVERCKIGEEIHSWRFFGAAAEMLWDNFFLKIPIH